MINQIYNTRPYIKKVVGDLNYACGIELTNQAIFFTYR